MDASSELTQLWELLGKGTQGNQSETGRHHAWPEVIKRYETLEVGVLWVYGTHPASERAIEPHHALAIVRDSVEGWLLEKGWRIEKVRDGEAYSASNSLMDNYKFFLLPEAVRYALESTPA